jgi:hypothetical protein
MHWGNCRRFGVATNAYCLTVVQRTERSFIAVQAFDSFSDPRPGPCLPAQPFLALARGTL